MNRHHWHKVPIWPPLEPDHPCINRFGLESLFYPLSLFWARTVKQGRLNMVYWPVSSFERNRAIVAREGVELLGYSQCRVWGLLTPLLASLSSTWKDTSQTLIEFQFPQYSGSLVYLTWDFVQVSIWRNKYLFTVILLIWVRYCFDSSWGRKLRPHNCLCTYTAF